MAPSLLRADSMMKRCRFSLSVVLALTAVSGCVGQGYAGDRCAALSSTDDIRSLPTFTPVDPAMSAPVSKLSSGPSRTAVRPLTHEFGCCHEQELSPSRACEVDCDAWMQTVGVAPLGAPFAGELCNGDRFGAATCAAYFSRETGRLVGTSSFCYD